MLFTRGYWTGGVLGKLIVKRRMFTVPKVHTFAPGSSQVSVSELESSMVTVAVNPDGSYKLPIKFIKPGAYKCSKRGWGHVCDKRG